MKTIKLYFLYFSISLFSSNCSNNSNKRNENSSKIIVHKYFDYDIVDHYAIEYSDADFLRTNGNKMINKIDSLKDRVVVGLIPLNINDTGFINSLLKPNCKHQTINPKDFKKIDTILSEKSQSDVHATACVHFYRDILIFKKRNKTIGIAKICFGCLDSKIITESSKEKYLMLYKDFDGLHKILKSKSLNR